MSIIAPDYCAMKANGQQMMCRSHPFYKGLACYDGDTLRPLLSVRCCAMTAERADSSSLPITVIA